MAPREYTTLVEALKEVPDPRKRKGVRYRWELLLGLIAAAMVAGQHHGRAIGQWVAEHSEVLSKLFGRVPSESTLRRALRLVDARELESVLSVLAQETVEQGELIGLSVDGKQLRGTGAYGRKVHLLGLVEHNSAVVLAEVEVGEQANEIAAVPQLLQGRDLAGAVITADAMLTQRELARAIRQQGGHYLMVVKDNQIETKETIQELFVDADWMRQRHKPYWEYRSLEKGHGRLEERRLESTTDANEYLSRWMGWEGVGQVMRRITNRVNLSTAEMSLETTYALTSLSPSQAGPKQLESLWRGHWSIENRVHYVRDVSMDEDACRAHTGNTPHAMAAIRNALIGLIRRKGWQRVPDALRHYNAHPLAALQLIGLIRL